MGIGRDDSTPAKPLPSSRNSRSVVRVFDWHEFKRVDPAVLFHLFAEPEPQLQFHLGEPFDLRFGSQASVNRQHNDERDVTNSDSQIRRSAGIVTESAPNNRNAK